MNAALYGSYAMLWALVAVQTVVLLEVLRRVVRLKREIYESMPVEMKEERLAGGTRVEFAARDLTHGGSVRTEDLAGAPATLLFLAAEAFVDGIPEWLLDTFVGLRTKGEGRLFVLCEGSAEACSALARRTDPEIPILLDERGEIRRRFLVSSTPGAVLLDEQAGVSMYGRPKPPSD